MKFSTRTRYGLRLLVYLGVYYNKRLVQLKEIAENEYISIKYLEQIVRILKPSGLISVTRGAKGGYALKIPPEDIFLDKVFEILEGSLDPIDCFSRTEPCVKEKFCSTREFWQGLSDVILEYLHSKTLKDLVLRYQELNKSFMFYI